MMGFPSLIRSGVLSGADRGFYVKATVINK